MNDERYIIPDIFVNPIKDLRRDFSIHFADFRQYGTLFQLFDSPYKTQHVEHVKEEYQVDLTNLQCNKSFKSKCQLIFTADFYMKYILPSGKQNILTNAKLMPSL